MNGNMPSNSVSDSARNNRTVQDFDTYFEYFMKDDPLELKHLLFFHYERCHRRLQSYDPSEFIYVLDVSSNGSVSTVELPPSGKELWDRESRWDFMPELSEYQTKIKDVKSNLHTRVVLVDKVLNPIFLESFAYVYDFDLEIVRKFLYLRDDGRFPDLHLPAHRRSDLRNQILDLGYGRFACWKEIKREDGESHAFNVVFSQYWALNTEREHLLKSKQSSGTCLETRVSFKMIKRQILLHPKNGGTESPCGFLQINFQFQYRIPSYILRKHGHFLIFGVSSIRLSWKIGSKIKHSRFLTGAFLWLLLLTRNLPSSTYRQS